MIQRLQVETWDGKAKILAELDVVEKLAEDKVIINVYGNNFKELTYQPELKYWKVTKECVDASTINKGPTERGSNPRAGNVKRRTKSVH